MTTIDGVIDRATMTVSEMLPQKSAKSTASLRDVFVGQVAEVTDLLGWSTERTPGARAAAVLVRRS